MCCLATDPTSPSPTLQDVESRLTGRIMQLEAALFNAEQLAHKVDKWFCCLLP